MNLTAGVLLYQVANALRQEQLTGTFEALLATPTSGATLQLGSVAYTLIIVPIRAAVLLTAIGLLFGLDLQLSGIAPALALLLCFLPFTWGLGLISARPRGHVPARGRRDRHARDAARPDLGRGLPDRPAAPAAAHDRRVEPVRDRDRRRSRRADRRHRLGRGRARTCCGSRRSRPSAWRSGCSASGGRWRASAGAERWGMY